MKLKGKVALVTGGSSGIGKGICLAFVKEGAKVVFNGRNMERGQQTEAEIRDLGYESTFIQSDLNNRSELKGLIEQVVEKYGKLDILVNNAHGGSSDDQLFENVSDEEMENALQGGFWPSFILMRESLPYLKETKGKVINFVSGSGMVGLSKKSTYVAAKEAVRGITRVAANEWGRYGITVNMVSPIAGSPGVDEWKESEPNAYEKMVSLIPLRRLGDAELDIGRATAFLASDEAGYITGQTIMVDGGTIQVR